MRNSFLRNTAESIVQTIGWERLSSVTFVLPSHRAGLVLTDALLDIQAEQQVKALWSPKVLTLNQLQDALSPLYAEDELKTIVRLYRHYRRLNAGDKDLMPLEMFYGWGKQMISDFTNIDSSMPAEQVPNFFDNTIAAHELSQWNLDEEVLSRLRGLMSDGSIQEAKEDSIRRQYEHLWRQLYDLYQSLRAEMSAEQKGYNGMRYRAVIEQWDEESVQQQIAGRVFVFVGFNYLLPVERELMSLLRDKGLAQFYWDYIPDFQTNEKAFSFTRLNARILGGERSAENSIQKADFPKEVTVMSCASREAQAQFVHRWLQENYTAKGQKVGVVICDESMLESVIQTLPPITLPGEEQPEPINITKGFPLRNTSVYARTIAWLYDKARGEAEQVLSPEFIEQLLAALIPDRQDEPDIAEPSEQSDALSWQELLILESEYQVRKIASQMRQLIAEGLGDVAVTLKLVRLLMRRAMESVSMPFHGEPVTDIQIMGVLETRMLDFDKLLLLNVEEGVIPQRQTDLSFIPFYLRKAYHMQTSDEKATIYAYNFFRLLSRTGYSTILFTTAETAEGGKGMSRFIMQMLVSPEFNVHKAQLQEPSIISQSAFEEIHLSEPAPLRSSLSPSALNTYISCPRSYYLQYIEHLRPEDEEEVLFAPNTMGSFVHHAMEYLYTRYLHCNNTSPVRVQPDEIEAIRTDEAKQQEALAEAYRLMNEAYAENHPDEPEHYVPEHHSGENVIILGYISNILERDREDAKEGLQIYLLEQKRTFPLTMEGIGTVQMGGIIDRLDIYGPEGHEKLRVVDYKSGSYGDSTHAKKMSASWEDIMESEDKGYVRQTLIYSHAVMTHDRTGLPIEPNLFFCRRKLTEIETTIDVGEETVRDYRAIQEDFLNALRGKVAQVMTATEFPPCAEDKCPSFCPFFVLCGRKPKEF
ncbi:MAG: PD-(D/E)XK nuclease family protein [Paludibacteraceae bacterium]|nr:PD-(D/E)XK nuclease family protein [Paludibacteraceae bacterium]